MRFWLFSFMALVLVIPALRAQTPPRVGAPSLCKPTDIDVTFSFTDMPVGRQTIDIHLRNSSLQPCTLRGELTPGFAVDGHGARVTTCWFCMPDGTTDAVAVQKNNDFVLPGHGSAHVTYQWSSVGDVCQKVDWVTFSVNWDGGSSYLFEANHWKPHVCSAMQISGFEHGPMPDSQPLPGTDAALQVTPPSSPIYADEWVKLTLKLQSPNGSVQPSGRCPELYAVYQNRFEPILPEGYDRLTIDATGKPGDVYISGYGDELPAEFKGRERVCDATGKNTTTTVFLPASLRAPIHVVPTPNLSTLRHIVWRAVSTESHQPVFVTADTQFHILDPDSLSANWGSEVDGIGAGLSIDRTSFKLGESIPLHLHWENFAAEVAIGVDECGEPGPQLEIQDASHHVLSTISTHDYGCMGHGWGPFSIQRGKPEQTFVSLEYGSQGYAMGELARITGPGVYYLVLVWSPPTFAAKTDQTPSAFDNGRSFGKTYATARSLPVRIEISDK